MDESSSRVNSEKKAPCVAGVVLAAGVSRRLGRPKQLVELGGEPAVRWTARALLASRLAGVVVVVGHESVAVGAALAGLPLRVVVNPDYEQGQSTSVRAGLAAVPDDADGVLFALGDQPEVEPGHVDALLEAFAATGAPIVQPVYGGVPGNPVLFARSLFPELERLTGEEGARGVIRAHATEVARVAVSDGPPPGDLDTEDDVRAMVARWGRRGAQ